jgi:hypothetical protein
LKISCFESVFRHFIFDILLLYFWSLPLFVMRMLRTKYGGWEVGQIAALSSTQTEGNFAFFIGVNISLA